MNYYAFHIGDFNSATRHLTRIERSVYRDLIDLYYDTEKALTLDFTALCRLIIAHSDEERTAVEQVLNEFFTRTEHGWFHPRCDEDIQKYHANIAAKSAAGKASAASRAKKTAKKANTRTTSVEHTNNDEGTAVQQVLNECATNQEPRTNNQEPNKKYSPDDLAVAEEMLGLIRVVNPNFKQPNLDRWANSVRLMRQRDGRPISEIRALFAWANQDSFWSANILSPDKLREKYDQLIARRRQAAGMPASPQRFDPMARLTDRSWASGVLDQPEEPDYIDVEYRRATA